MLTGILIIHSIENPIMIIDISYTALHMIMLTERVFMHTMCNKVQTAGLWADSEYVSIRFLWQVTYSYLHTLYTKYISANSLLYRLLELYKKCTIFTIYKEGQYLATIKIGNGSKR